MNTSSKYLNTRSKNIMAKIEEEIINFLSAHPYQEFYNQEIVNKLKCSKGSASELLRSLARKKIVLQKIKGQMKFYQINAASMVVKQYKTNLALEEIKHFTAKLAKSSKKIILFGSASRGEQTAESDIDLFILTNNKEECRTIIKKNKKINLPINAIIKTPNEWSEMEEKEPEFYYEIKNGITIYDANFQ